MQEATEPNEIVVSLSSIFSASGSSLHAHHEPDGAEKPHVHHGDQHHHDHPSNQPHGAHGSDDAAAAHPGVSSRDSERSADGDGRWNQTLIYPDLRFMHTAQESALISLLNSTV